MAANVQNFNISYYFERNTDASKCIKHIHIQNTYYISICVTNHDYYVVSQKIIQRQLLRSPIDSTVPLFYVLFFVSFSISTLR